MFGFFIFISIIGIIFFREIKTYLYLKNSNHKYVFQDFDIEYFGKLNSNDLKEYYDTLIEVNQQKISIDLNFNDEYIGIENLKETNIFLQNLEKHILKTNSLLLNELKNNIVIKEYVEYHLNEFNEDELLNLNIELTDDFEKKYLKFLKQIHIKRIGIYPDDLNYFAIFDYTINEELTQYLIVMSLDSKGNLIDVVEES